MLQTLFVVYSEKMNESYYILNVITITISMINIFLLSLFITMKLKSILHGYILYLYSTSGRSISVPNFAERYGCSYLDIHTIRILQKIIFE